MSNYSSTGLTGPDTLYRTTERNNAELVLARQVGAIYVTKSPVVEVCTAGGARCDVGSTFGNGVPAAYAPAVFLFAQAPNGRPVTVEEYFGKA